MAKNLKISVKNAQLAQALNLSKLKKPAKKKKAAGEEAPAADLEAAPEKKTRKTTAKKPAATKKVAAAKEEVAKEEAPKKPEPKAAEQAPKEVVETKAPTAEAKPEVKTPPPAPEKEAEKATPPPAERPQRPPSSSYTPRHASAPRYQSERPSSGPRYQSDRPSSGPRYQSDRPSSGPRYQSDRPGAGGYPPRRPPHGGPGQRPQYGGPGQRSQYGGGQQGQYRPYTPRTAGPQGDSRFRPQRPGGSYPPGRQGEHGARPPFRPRQPGTGGGPGGGYRPGGFSGPRSQGPGAGPRPPFVPRSTTPPPAGESKDGERKRSFGVDAKKTPSHREFREVKPSKRSEGRAFDARDRYGLRSDEDGAWRKRRPSHKARHAAKEEVIRPKSLHVRLPITIKDLAAEMKLKASQLISKLFMQGVVVTINDLLDDETTIQLLGHEFECEITIDRSEEERLKITDKTIKQEIQETEADKLVLRSPVVTFMGHVDHGKTSLIDAIRASDITAGEAGAITQHIGAFTCHTAAGNITILDTPGHEAFSAMRERGADVTDIVVLVIAGDEGMRTQTIEALEQARNAEVPIIVAINKCDKPNFDADNIYRQLADQNLLPEAWGGQTVTQNCSAVTKQGISELLEMLALQAEILELKADPSCRARGTVIESEMHKGLGYVATVLVQNGTLHLGDALVFEHEFAKVKTMHDEHDKALKSAGPSTPVKITGLSGLPSAGSEFIVVKNEKEASDITKKRSEGHRHKMLHQTKKGVESVLAEQAATAKKKVLNLILRADVQGSVEALKTSLLKIESDKIELNIISAAVGEVSESDVQLASTSKAVIVGFHTKIESHAEGLIRSLHVDVRMHDIIYHAVDDIKAHMLSLLDKVAQENDVGSAEVKAVFKASQLGIIAGCQVIDGTIKRSSHVKLMRNGEMVWKGAIQSLKRVKDDVREVSKGQECGIVLAGHSDIQVGDILQAFEITYLQQEL